LPEEQKLGKQIAEECKPEQELARRQNGSDNLESPHDGGAGSF
jgi:hypothetical protein